MTVTELNGLVTWGGTAGACANRPLELEPEERVCLDLSVGPCCCGAKLSISLLTVSWGPCANAGDHSYSTLPPEPARAGKSLSPGVLHFPFCLSDGKDTALRRWALRQRLSCRVCCALW